MLLAIACLVASPSAAESERMRSFVDDVIAVFGFDPADKGTLEGGRILTKGLPDLERQSNELAVGAVLMLVRRPLDVVAKALVSDAIFRANTEILDYRTIGDGSEGTQRIEAVFDAVRYTEAEDDEVERLLRAEPGSEFNLSEQEIGAFRQIGDASDGTRERVSAAMADVLLGRYRTYQANGLNALEPYARSGGKTASPRRELTLTFGSLEILDRYFPDFYAGLLRYPDGPRGGLVQRFYWIKRIANDRPAYVLTHRMEQAHGEFVVASELQYYVGHAYNSMLSLIACVPSEGGTLVLSVSRLFTDQVTGFGSGLKKKIGRGQVVEAVAKLFEKLRDELERPAAGEPRG